MAQEKVYVQWRETRRLHLVAAGYAYLLPGTTLLLRCPTRHFRKGRVRWLKDGKPLVGVPHVSVAASGCVKIQQVRPSDAGVYTCVAGSAHEHFVLRVSGGAPEARRQEAGPSDGTLAVQLDRYDAFVERLLELRRPREDEDGAKNPEDGGPEESSLFVLIADTYRLNQLLSGLGGPRAPLLTAQLFHQLAATQGDAGESTPPPPQIKAQTPKPKSPAIVRRPLTLQPSAAVVVAVAAPVLLQRSPSSLDLRCDVPGDPEPSLTWTRNGKKLPQNSR